MPLEMTTEEVKKEIRRGIVIEGKRLQMNKGGEKTDSLSILVMFKQSMPREVRIGWINYRVREYIPQPLRCSKCQRMGHKAVQCKGRQRCAKCSGEHECGKCDKGARLKCCSCGGEHSAAYGDCNVQKQARKRSTAA